MSRSASLELGWPLCLGEAYCCTARPSDSCYLRPERQNCQRREPEAAMSCSPRRPPGSLPPAPSGTTRGRDQREPNVHGRMESLSAHQGRPACPESLTMVRTIRFVCRGVYWDLLSFPFPSPVLLPSFHLSIAQQSVGWLRGNSSPRGKQHGRYNAEYKPANYTLQEVANNIGNKIHALYQGQHSPEGPASASPFPSTLYHAFLHSFTHSAVSPVPAQSLLVTVPNFWDCWRGLPSCPDLRPNSVFPEWPLLMVPASLPLYCTCYFTSFTVLSSSAVISVFICLLVNSLP